MKWNMKGWDVFLEWLQHQHRFFTFSSKLLCEQKTLLLSSVRFKDLKVTCGDQLTRLNKTSCLTQVDPQNLKALRDLQYPKTFVRLLKWLIIGWVRFFFLKVCQRWNQTHAWSGGFKASLSMQHKPQSSDFGVKWNKLATSADLLLDLLTLSVSTWRKQLQPRSVFCRLVMEDGFKSKSKVQNSLKEICLLKPFRINH